MAPVKWPIALTGVLILAVAGVDMAQRIEQGYQFRRLLAEGELALQAGQTYVAIESFSGALALRPASMVAFYRRGEAYGQQGQDDRALSDLRQARRLAPDAPEPLEALGRLYDRRGDPAEAAEWFAQAADRLRDSDPSLLYLLALARYRSGSPAQARAPLRLAIARDDTMPEAYYLMGLVARDAQAPDEAIAALEHAVRLAPSLVAAREELADLYRARGRPNDEIAELRALAALDARPDRQLALARAYLDVRRYDDALQALARARADAPDDSRIELGLGRVYLAQAEHTGSAASLRRALDVLEAALGGSAPRSEGLALLGRGLYLSGDAAGAERLLQEAVSTSPVDPEAFGFLADAAERRSHPALAHAALVRLDALEGDTASRAARAARARRIGRLALAAGDPQGGADALLAAVRGGRDDGGTLGLLAEAYWRSGRHEDARATLARAYAAGADADDLRGIADVIK